MVLQLLSKSCSTALLALISLAIAGCHPQVKPRVAADFAAGRLKVRSVALLPMDVSLSVADPEFTSVQVAALQEDVIRAFTESMSGALSQRGYRVVTKVLPDGTGRAPGGRSIVVIHPTDLVHLRLEIHNASRKAAGGAGNGRALEAKISADLSGQVGRTTGADASLYARSWVHLAPSGSDSSAAVAVIISVLLVLLVVGIIIAILASKGKAGGGGKGAAKATAHLAKGAARAAFVMGRVALRTAPFVAAAAMDAHHQHLHCYRCDEPRPGPTSGEAPPPHEAAGPQQNEPGMSPPRPGKRDDSQVLVLRESKEPPEKSTVGLMVSLVHNASGRLLWHAEQEQKLRVEEGVDVEDLAEHFLKHLPPQPAPR